VKKYVAELVGTFILVLFGVGTAVTVGKEVGVVGIAIAFGFGLVAAAYGIGPISGCHINPAVSLGVFMLATGLLTGYNVAVSGLGQDGWGAGYGYGYGVGAAFLFEFVATMVFLIVILGSTQKAAPAGFAGLTIGTTLMIIHILGIRITGVSVNPARSLGPALFAGGQAISQLWLFFVAPLLGGLVGGLLFRTKLLEVDEA